MREVKCFIIFRIPKEGSVIFSESAQRSTPPGMPNLLTTLHLHGSTQGVLAADAPCLDGLRRRPANGGRELRTRRRHPQGPRLLAHPASGAPAHPCCNLCSYSVPAPRLTLLAAPPPLQLARAAASLVLQEAAAASFAHQLPAPCAPPLLAPRAAPAALAAGLRATTASPPCAPPIRGRLALATRAAPRAHGSCSRTKKLERWGGRVGVVELWIGWFAGWCWVGWV